MKGYWIAKGLKYGVMMILFFVLMTYVVMWLWNWILPDLFGFGELTFWKAAGLLLLSKILFGGFHKHGGGRGHWKSGGHWKHKMKAKWDSMNDEERAEFRDKIQKYCPAQWKEFEKEFGTPSAQAIPTEPTAG